MRATRPSVLIERLESRRLLSASPLDPNFGAAGFEWFNRALNGANGNDGALGTGGLAFLPNRNILAAVELSHTVYIKEWPGEYQVYTEKIDEFSPDGVLVKTTDFGSVSDNPHRCTAITRLSNGNFLATGYVYAFGFFSHVAVAQEYRPDLTPVGSLMQIPDGETVLAVQPDGKLLFYDINRQNTIIRQNHDGTLDHTFNGGKPVPIDFAPQVTTLQPDGKILLSGQTTVNGSAAIELARLNANGSFDTTFGTAGIQRLALDTAPYGLQSIALEPDGHILVSGNAVNPALSGADNQLEAVRLTANGQFDPSFATSGVLYLPQENAFGSVSKELYTDSLLIVGRGRIIALLMSYDSAGVTHFFVSRFLLDGQPDTGFNDGSVLPLAPPIGGYTLSALQDPNTGRIVIEAAGGLARVLQTPPAPSTGSTNAIFSGTVSAVDLFGSQKPFIGAVVYADINHNGRLDAGDVSSQVDKLGHYQLTLAPGTYDIAVVVRHAAKVLRPASVFYKQTLAPGALATYGNFLLAAPGVISGRIFLDENRDGKAEPNEYTQRSAVVYLDLNNDGKLDAGDYTAPEPLGLPYAPNDLSFQIVNVPPGLYTVRIANIDPRYQTSGPTVYSIRVGPNFTVSNINFGLTTPGDVVSGTVFDDRNKNGVQDPGEPPLAGWHVVGHSLNGPASNPLPVVGEITDASGHYSITVTRGVEYTVALGQPSSSVVDNGLLGQTVNSATSRTLNFAVEAGTISGIVYQDTNGNGRMDAGETGIAGVSLSFLQNFGSGQAQPTRGVETDSSGRFDFGPLPPDTYQVFITSDSVKLQPLTVTSRRPANSRLRWAQARTLAGWRSVYRSRCNSKFIWVFFHPALG